MFEKTLTDLVTGIRAHKRDTALFISQNIAEIKNELRSSDMFTKANALQKLTFLQMMGYTMSWAAFAAVEVMSSPRFALKRTGCLAACQGLDQPDRSPVVLLTTNLLKKELRGATVGGGSEGTYAAGVAINCLSNIVTEDLGRELLPDLLHLLRHPQPYVRKKALLCLYKVFLKYPQGLRLSFDQIKLCLEDANPSVVSCAVNVITELSDANPKNYLPLAPAFFKLLTSSANNWMLIKVVKLLGSLVPEEPRLAKKLLEPLSNIVRSTHAKSLLYEAVFAITLCLQYVKKSSGSQPSTVPEAVELCVTTLRDLVSDDDQNLKYLGLVGLASLLQSQPRVFHDHSECKPLVLKCLSDEDVTIRTRALGLLTFMTTRRNLVDLISQLLKHVEAASGDYRAELVGEILRMCSAEKYDLVEDFAWYVDVLVVLAGVRGAESQGEAIAKQWMDVAWRVLPVRGYAVRRSLEVLVCRGPGSDGGSNGGDRERHVAPEVLPAAAWVVGEYSGLIPDALENEGLDPRYDASSRGPYHALVQSMTAPADAAGVDPLEETTQAVFVQNAMKVFAAACQLNQQNRDGIGVGGLECSDDELHACVGTLMKHLVIYSESTNVEVKERAFTAYQLLLSIGLPSDVSALTTDAASIGSKCRASSSMLTYIFTPEPMKPISAKAQKRKLAEGPPSPVSVEEWEADVNWDAFSFFDEETPCFDAEGNMKGSLEQISFTKQQSNATTGDGMGGGFAGTEAQTGLSVEGTEETSFAGSGTFTDSAMGSTHLPSSSHRKEGDPFYLPSSSGPALGLFSDSPNVGGDKEKDAKDAADAAARFGSIQLESGDESEEGHSSAKGKRKKKKKAKKAAGAKHPQKFVESDDDDDDDFNHAPRQPSPNKRGVKSKDLQNLALVDLTTPLGEDEVMPRNEHYVVPERPVVESTKSPKKAKKKKKKKTKSKKNEQQAAPAVAVEGDLLGFDTMAFGSAVAGSSKPGDDANAVVEIVAAAPSSNSNPINDAFDDLLGLEMSQPIAATDTMVQEAADALPAKEKPAKSKSKKQKKHKKNKKK